jgi:hypothetical protein
MESRTIEEIREHYGEDLPEYAVLWIKYFETFVRKVNVLTNADNIVTLKIEALEESGFQICYEVRTRIIDEENGYTEEYEAYEAHPKETDGSMVMGFLTKEYSDLRPEELADMVDQVFSENIIDFQSWYILTYFNAELVAYITGMDVFRELMLESSARIQIKKDEQETSRENKLRVKTNNWIMGAGDLLDRLNLLRSKIFGNNRILENKTIAKRKNRVSNAQFIDRIKKERAED